MKYVADGPLGAGSLLVANQAGIVGCVVLRTLAGFVPVNAICDSNERARWYEQQ
jgi:hypothetical protein